MPNYWENKIEKLLRIIKILKPSSFWFTGMKNLGTGRFTAGDMTARVVRGPRDLITGCSPWFPVNRYFQQKQTIVLINFVFLEFIYLFIYIFPWGVFQRLYQKKGSRGAFVGHVLSVFSLLSVWWYGLQLPLSTQTYLRF